MSLVTFFSPRGGAGVTTCAANASVALARMGLTVTVADLSGRDTLKTLLGVPLERPVLGSSRYRADAILHHGVRVAAMVRDAAVHTDRADFVRAVSDWSEVVVADLSGLDPSAIAEVGAMASLNVCVLGADAASIVVLPAALDLMESVPNARALINQVDRRRRVHRQAEALYEATFGDGLFARVSADEAANEAAAHLEPVSAFAPASAADRDFTALASAINRLLPALLSHFPE